MEKEFDGNIPAICVYGASIPEAHEKSLLALREKGLWYARSGPKDKGRQQVDSTMMMQINYPNSGPLIHKFLVACPVDSLLEFGYEILGAKDELVVDPQTDPANDTRWTYTYFGRFKKYNKELGRTIDQVAAVIRKIGTEPNRRSSQMITWQPETDLTEKDPACMQRAWFFAVPMPDGSFNLNGNYSFRSRNPMIAAPMNLFGQNILQNYIAQQATIRSGRKITSGRIVDISDSYHVSADNQEYFRSFLEQVDNSVKRGETIEQRAFSRDWVVGQMQDMIETGEIKDKIAGQLKDRFTERKQAHPGLSKSLDERADIALAELSTIHEQLRGILV